MTTAQYKKGIEIVVMSHDRQVETLRAVAAIKKIDFGVPTTIVVSDNPSTERNIVQGLPADVKHIVRSPCVSSNEHLSLIDL